MENSIRTNSSLALISILLTVIGIVGKIIGFLREIIFADQFGLSYEFDLFLASSSIPVLLNSATVYLSQHYFIPTFNKIKSNSESDSVDFFRNTFWLFIICGVFLSGLLFFFSGVIFDFIMNSASEDSRRLGIQLFSIFLITIPLNSGMSIITAYLQANFQFILPALSQLVLNIVIIVLIIILSDKLNVFILPLSYLAATVICFTILFLKIKNKINLRSVNLFKVDKKFLNLNSLFVLILIEGFSLSYSLTDRYFIGYLPSGGLAALNYSFVIYLLPVTIFSLPLITIMFSKFSESASKGKYLKLKSDFLNAFNISVYIFIPLSFLIYFWGDILLKLFYERGKFTSSDTDLTFSTLQYYMMSLVVYSSYLLNVKLLYSLNKFNFVLVISIAAIVLKILLNNYLVMPLLQNGLAISTSFVYIFLFGVSTLYCSKLLKIENRKILFMLKYTFFHSAIAFCISQLVGILLRESYLLSSIIEVFVFIFSFLLMSYYLKDRELHYMIEAVFNTILKSSRLIFRV